MSQPEPQPSIIDQHWLTSRRLKAIAAVAVAINLLAIAKWIWQWQFTDLGFLPAGLDFIAYWTASLMAADGRAALAYDLNAFFAAQKLAVPTVPGLLTWQYPPGFLLLLLLLPLSLLPYLPAYLAWTASTLLAFGVVLRRIVPPGTSILLLALPGVMRNATYGQNGFLTGALMGGGLLLLSTRPLLAGVLFGLLTIKPHLGLLLPMALLAIGAWRTIISAAATAIVFHAASLIVLGPDTLGGFIDALPRMTRQLASGELQIAAMPTVYSFARGLGAQASTAAMAHCLVAMMVAVIVVKVWRTVADAGMRAAVLTAGSLLISPYLYDYDLAWLTLPIAWFAVDALRSGWRSLERELLLLVAMLPMLVRGPLEASGVQPAVLVLLLFFAMTVRRAQRFKETGKAGDLALVSAGADAGAGHG